MADRVVAPQALRALDDNGDPISGALLYFYDTGTTSPQTVYADSGLASAHPSPLVADGDGYFDPVFASGTTAMKMDMQTAGGASLTGYPIDPVIAIGATNAGASAITFSPVTSVPETNVQDGLEHVGDAAAAAQVDATAALAANVVNATAIATEKELGDNSRNIVATAGTVDAYTLAASNPISAYATGQEFLLNVDRLPTVPGDVTLNVDSIGAKAVKKINAAGTKTALESGDLRIGLAAVAYDGTDFVIISASPAPMGMQFIESWTHSSDVGFVDFTDLGDYTELLVMMVDVQLSSSSAYSRIRTSADNGVSFHGDGGSTVYKGTFVENSADGQDVASSGVGGLTGATTSARSALAKIFGFNSSDVPTFFRNSGGFSTDTQFSHAYHTSNVACNAIRISTHPGEAATYDFTAGSIYLMGVKS